MHKKSTALRDFVLEPIEKRRPALMSLRVAQLLHDRTLGRSDAHFRRIGTMFRPPAPLPPAVLMDDNAISTSVAALRRRGWDILPHRLSESDIAALREFAFSTPAYAVDLGEKIRIDESHIPRDYGRYMWRISDLFQLPVVQKLIAESTLHEIAQRYIACRPVMTSLTLWLDPVYDKNFAAHVYHYDNDGPAFLKFFVYLTDVDIDSGAHSYIEGSHGAGKPAHLGRARRYERKDLLDHYGPESEIVFSAPAGTIIAEDTSGFHKGTTLRKGYRLLLQMQYALLDIPNEEEFDPAFQKVRIETLDPAIRRICRKFIA